MFIYRQSEARANSLHLLPVIFVLACARRRVITQSALGSECSRSAQQDSKSDDRGSASGLASLRCRLTFSVSDNAFTPTDGSNAHNQMLWRAVWAERTLRQTTFHTNVKVLTKTGQRALTFREIKPVGTSVYFPLPNTSSWAAQLLKVIFIMTSIKTRWVCLRN